MKRILSILLAIILVATSCVGTLFASAEPTAYTAWEYDFETSIPADSAVTYKANNASVTLGKSIENGALKLTAETGTADRNMVYKVDTSGIKANTKYHVSVTYQLVSGTFKQLTLGAYNNSDSVTSLVQTPTFGPLIVTAAANLATGSTLSYYGTLTTPTKAPSFLYFGFMAKGSVQVLVDEIIFAEVIDVNGGVTATSANAAQGTATVTNRNKAFTDFAKGEKAVFSAVPAAGYEFVNWTDATGTHVSTKTSYQTPNLVGDLTLTANFKKADYLSVTYDYESDAFDPEKFGTYKRYTNKHIVSHNTSADAIEGKSFQIELNPTGASGSGHKRGYLAEDNAYLLKAGNIYHITLTAKLSAASATPIGISLATLKSGDPSAGNIPNNIMQTSANQDAAFYLTSTTPVTSRLTVIPKVDGYLAYNSTNLEHVNVLIDNIVITEVIDDAEGNSLVSAVTDSQKGDVTVTNAVGTFGNLIARGESAIFNATAKQGYSFREWQDATGALVSTNRAYQIDNVQAPVTLTAVFEKLADGEAQDGQYVIDFEVTPNATFRDNKSTATSSANIITDGINGKSLEFTAKYNETNDHYTSYFIKLNGLKANSVYSVKGKYQVTNGVLPKLRVGLIAFNSGATQGFTESGEYLAVTTDTPVMNEAAEFTGFIQTHKTDAPLYLVISTVTVNEVTFLIDDLELSESEYQTFYGHGNVPQKDTLINFDDYYITTTRPLQIKVDAAPARDGVATDGLHIFATEDLGPAILNWGTTTTNSDRWFTLPVKENTLYRWSMWVYIPSISPTWGGNIPYMEYYIDYVNNVSLSLRYVEERDGWTKLEQTFTTRPGQTKLSMTFNAGEKPKEMWLDDFRITEIDPGTMVETDLSYCEEDYNLFAELEQYDDILAGKSGVYELKTNPSAQYTFGVTTVGGNTDSKVYLSFDGKTVMPQSEPDASIALAKADTKRMGTEFVSASNGILYLVIENPNNAMQITNIQLFKTKSIGTERDMGYDADPNLSDPTYVIETLRRIDEEDVFESPETGDATAVLPVLLVAITALCMIFLVSLRKKGGAR